MSPPHIKMTYVRPICGHNEESNKNFTPQNFDTSEQVEFISSNGLSYKEESLQKTIIDSKSKHDENLSSALSKLFGETEKIQKWITSIQLESKQKSKRLNDLTHRIESQKKVLIDLQMENENLSVQLNEEIQQRNFVLEKFYSTKEMCSALKESCISLQKQFDKIDRMKEIVKASNLEKMKTLEDLTRKFNVLRIEGSEKVESLKSALLSEREKANSLKELLDQHTARAENEQESLCKALRSYQADACKLIEELKDEKCKSQCLDQEKNELKSNIIKMEDMNKVNLQKLKEMEEELKTYKECQIELEKKYLSECSLVKDWKRKYEDFEETVKNNNLQFEECISHLKQSIENLENTLGDMKVKLVEEEAKNEKISSELVAKEKEINELETKLLQTDLKLEMQENFQHDIRNLQDEVSKYILEITDLKVLLEKGKQELFELKAEKECLSKRCDESEEKYVKISQEYEELAQKSKTFTHSDEEYCDLMKKIESLEQDVKVKSELIIINEENLLELQEKFGENEKLLEQLRYENVDVQKKLEAEKEKVNKCVECEIMQQKVNEMEKIQNDLKKAEEGILMQKEEKLEIMRLLDKTEKFCNEKLMLHAKETIEYKKEIKKLEDELRCLAFKVKDLETLQKENEKLKSNIEELKWSKVESSEILKNENLKLKGNIEEIEKDDNVNNKQENQDKMEADSSNEMAKQMKHCGLLSKEIKRKWELSSSDSECIDLDKALDGKNIFTSKRQEFPYSRKDKLSPATKRLSFIKPTRFITNRTNTEARLTKLEPSKKNKANLVTSDNSEKSQTKYTDFFDFLPTKENCEKPPKRSMWTKQKIVSNYDSPSTPIVKKFFKTPRTDRKEMLKMSRQTKIL